MRKLITAALAVLAPAGIALAAAAPASASTGTAAFCTDNGYNGTQEDGNGLLLANSAGTVIATRSPAMFSGCFRWDAPATPPAGTASLHPKYAELAPVGSPDGQAITAAGTGVKLENYTGAKTQLWTYNPNFGSWSPVSNLNESLSTEGNGKPVKLVPFTTTPPPSEVFTFVPGA